MVATETSGKATAGTLSRSQFGLVRVRPCSRAPPSSMTTSEPLAGWRHVEVTERHTAVDFTQQMRRPMDETSAQAEAIRVLLDNLNTHTPATLQAAFPVPEARRLARKLEFHYAPKHGS
jgi:DDE superfamily endonuclease